MLSHSRESMYSRLPPELDAITGILRYTTHPAYFGYRDDDDFDKFIYLI